MSSFKGAQLHTASSISDFMNIGQIDLRTKPILVKSFKVPSDRISIVPITDLHYGAKNCNVKKLEAYLAYIMRTPGCYGIGLGDYMEFATRTSVGLGMYEEDIHSQEQFEFIKRVLTPLARAKKLIGLHDGNHEMRARKNGLNPIKILADDLGIPYLGYMAMHKWIVGDQLYRAVTVHGSSGARTSSGRLQALKRITDVVEADLYMMGHLHDQVHFHDQVYRIDPAVDHSVRRIRHYVICGSLLEYFDGYAEMMSLPPTPTGLIRIDLHADRHHVGYIPSY